MSDYINTVILSWALFIAPALVLSNASRDVYADQIELAAKWCEPHGGVVRIDGTVYQNNKANTSFKCKDGTEMNVALMRQK